MYNTSDDAHALRMAPRLVIKNLGSELPSSEIWTSGKSKTWATISGNNQDYWYQMCLNSKPWVLYSANLFSFGDRIGSQISNNHPEFVAESCGADSVTWYASNCTSVVSGKIKKIIRWKIFVFRFRTNHKEKSINITLVIFDSTVRQSNNSWDMQHGVEFTSGRSQFILVTCVITSERAKPVDESLTHAAVCWLNAVKPETRSLRKNKQANGWNTHRDKITALCLKFSK